MVHIKAKEMGVVNPTGPCASSRNAVIVGGATSASEDFEWVEVRAWVDLRAVNCQTFVALTLN